MSITVTTPICLKNARKGRKTILASGPSGLKSIGKKLKRARQAAPQERDRIPRISRLMALAIHFEGLIQKGVARDYADLARLGGVSRARVTQIMNLLNLAPALQERLLFEPEGWTERELRSIAARMVWGRQML